MSIPVLLSHQIAAQQQMAVLTGDLSVARMPGGQQSKVHFKQYMDKQKTVHPQEIGTFRKTDNGAIEPTSNPLDFGLVGNGYFKILTDDGVRYTRNGRGRLVEGEVIIGKNGKLLMDDDSPLTLPAGTSISDLKVNSDFSVTIKGEAAGKLGVARFNNEQRMTYLKNEHLFKTDEEALPAENEDGHLVVNVQQGAYEKANISPTNVLMSYMETQRRFQAVEEMMKKVHRDEIETISSWLKIAV